MRSWGVPELNTIKKDNDYFKENKEDYPVYLSNTIPIHRRQVAKVRHNYHCECDKNYAFKGTCAKD